MGSPEGPTPWPPRAEGRVGSQVLAPSEAMVAITVTRLALNKAASSFSAPPALGDSSGGSELARMKSMLLFWYFFPFLTHFRGWAEGNFRHRMFQSYIYTFVFRTSFDVFGLDTENTWREQIEKRIAEERGGGEAKVEWGRKGPVTGGGQGRGRDRDLRQREVERMGQVRRGNESERKGKDKEWGCCNNLLVLLEGWYEAENKDSLLNLQSRCHSSTTLSLNQHICFNDFHKHINYNLQSLQYFFWYFISVIAEAIYEVNDSAFNLAHLKCVPLSFLFQKESENNKETKLITWKVTNVLRSQPGSCLTHFKEW